jgi:ribosomal protein S18 acetylase RimI-like enzyme
MKSKLPKGYVIKEVPTEDFGKLWEKPATKIFSDNLDYYGTDLIDTETERRKFKELIKDFNGAKAFRINLALYHEGKFVGWSWGFQQTALSFYMCNSAILPKHRRKGLYTILMKEVVKRAVAKGFQSIFSRHIMTNNDVIIAKLKAGFKITSVELSERFGTLVHLTYFPQKTRQEILDFRSGFKYPSKKIKKIFKL